MNVWLATRFTYTNRFFACSHCIFLCEMRFQNMFSNYSPCRNPSQTGKDKFCKGKFWRFIFKEGQILDQWNGGRSVPFAFLALQVFPLIPGFSKTAGTSDANKWLICQHTSVSSPTRLTYINYIAFTRCMRAWPNTGMPLSIKRFNLQRMALQPPEKSRGGWGLGFAMKTYAVGGKRTEYA